VHPEVSFRVMAGASLPYAKTSWAGQMRRRALLHTSGIMLHRCVTALTNELSRP